MPRKRARAWEQETPPAKKTGALRSLRNALVTALILLLIAYITGLAIGRTDGFRSIVADRLSRTLGMPVKLDRVSLSPTFNMTLRELETEGASLPGRAGLRVQRIGIEWRWRDLLRRGRVGIDRLNVEKPVVVFARGDDGAWIPEPLAPLADFLARHLQVAQPAEPPRAPSSANAPASDSAARKTTTAGARFDLKGLDTAVSVRRGEMSWWFDANIPQASIEGITLHATPLSVPGRQMTHVLVNVKRASSLNGPAFRELTLELLEAGDQQILLRFTADHQQ